MSFGQFQFRRGTAAQWTSANPTLLSGEFGLETDTTLFKVGDGTTAWNSLSYGGLSGGSSYTSSTANFTVPAINSNVTITVTKTSFMSTNAPLYIAGAGSYTVVTVNSSTSVDVKNTGATGNAVPTTVINSGALVAAAGVNGVNGANGQGVPIGGTTGQALTKNSATDYDTGWTSVVPASRTIATISPLNGGGSLSSNLSLSLTTTPTLSTPVGAARTITTTAPLTIGGGASADLSSDRTIAISAATTSTPGSMSANDKKKEDNMYYDVTANSIATLIGDDLTDNTSAWNTLFAGLPVGATVFFPSGTYRTSTGFNISADKHLRIQGAGKYVTVIKTTGATGNGFQINGSYWYNSFEDMAFTHLLTGSSVTGGAGININPGASGSAVGTNIYRCSFSGLFVGIRAVGSQAANLSVWDSIDITASSTGFANAVPNARGILWNGDTINMVLSNSTINMVFPAPAFSQFPAAATACMEVNQSGAIQLIGGEFIGGTNTLLLNGNAGGTTSVAAVYATNSFFDQSNGSTVKITGANIVNRVKFVQCGITTGNTGATGAIAVEIASTGTGAAGTATAAADGIDFFDCDIYPNGVTGTTNGFQITGSQGVAINACRISGFTNAITVTPAVSNGYTKIAVTNNKLGATNNFTTPNTNGLVLNAGSFQYGAVVVAGNDFTGNTSPIIENAAVSLPWQELYESNIGIVSPHTAPASTANQAFTTGATGIITGSTISIPTNGFRIGNTFRWTVPMQKTTAAGTLLAFAVKFGTTNSAADANIATGSFTGTGAMDSGTLEVLLTITALGGSANSVSSFSLTHQLSITGFVIAPNLVRISGTPTAFNSGITSGYLNLAIITNTATVPTVIAPVVAEILR